MTENNDDEIEAEFIPSENDVCTWTNDPDEKRRTFVANLLANSEHEIKLSIDNMQALCDWIRTGKASKSHLKVVAGSNDPSSKNKGGL